MANDTLQNYSLLKEDDNHYHLQHKDGSSFKVAKKLITPSLSKKMSGIKMHDAEIQNAEQGGKQPEPKIKDDFDRTVEDLGLGEKQARERYEREQASLPKTPGEIPPTANAPAVVAETQPVDALSLMRNNGNTQAPVEMQPADTLDLMRNNSNTQAPINPGLSVGQPNPGDTTRDPASGDVQFTPRPDVIPKNPGAAILKTPTQEFNEGFKQEQAGISAEAKAKADQGRALATTQDTLTKNLQEAKVKYDTRINELNKQGDNLFEEIKNGKIDPNHYWNSLSTGGQITAAIAIALGGLGGGMMRTGGNAALDVINKAIDRDMDAQKANLNKQNNLLARNLEVTKNLNEAESITRSQLLTVANAQVAKAGANAMGPVAQAEAQKLSGALSQKIAQTHISMAGNEMLMNLAGSGSGAGTNISPARIGQVINAISITDPVKAKGLQERFIPGIGLAQVPVPESVRENLIAKQTLDTLSSDFYDWASKHSGSISPTDINIGKTKAAELQSLYRNSINGGVFKKGEQEFIDQIVDSDPTKFFNSVRVLPKLKEVMESNRSQLGTLKKGYGLPTGSESVKLNAPVLKKE